MNKFDLPDRSYDDLFDAIKGWVEGQDRAESLFFSGSIANGDADEFSDLDFVIIAEDLDFYPTLLKEARTVIDHIETVVLENRLHPIASISILSLITEKWHRVDLAFGSSTSGILSQCLVPILDPKKLWVEAIAEQVPPPATGEEVTSLVNEFLRVLGLSVVVTGRADVHVGHDGATLLRNMLIELMLMEPPRRLRPGAKKILPVLNEEQQAVLVGLPTIADDVNLIHNFSEAVAAVFFQRARALVASLGSVWPTEFEAATRLYLRGTIDI